MTVSRLLLQLLVLLGVLLVHYGAAASFAKSHIAYPKTGPSNPSAYCNQMMRRRGMTRPRCKPSNTFIHARPKDITAVCRRGGRRHQRNLYDSNRSFQVTYCRNTGTATNCNYNGQTMNRRVRLGCVHRKPVHFEKLL